MTAKKIPKHKPRWFRTTFGMLLPGYWFKASKSQVTWWIKADGEYATSENRQLRQRWFDLDTVWIDLNTTLDRSIVARTAAAE